MNPDTCGNYAASDFGRKIRAFLQASVRLEESLKESERAMLAICTRMGEPLNVQFTGSLQEDCTALNAAIRDNIRIGIRPGAQLTVNYQPARCEIDMNAAAEIVAKCEGKARADVQARCDGTCQGTCNGRCDGECEGQAGTGGNGGSCNGRCRGTCGGTCSGSCEGKADFDASASCKAKAKADVSFKAECTKPRFVVDAKAGVVIDTSRIEAVKATLENGIPELMTLNQRVAGPIQMAFDDWVVASKELAGATPRVVRSFGDQAACVSGQIAAAAAALGRIRASINVQVKVSASVRTSASAKGGASGGAGGGI